MCFKFRCQLWGRTFAPSAAKSGGGGARCPRPSASAPVTGAFRGIPSPSCAEGANACPQDGTCTLRSLQEAVAGLCITGCPGNSAGMQFPGETYVEVTKQQNWKGYVCAERRLVCVQNTAKPSYKYALSVWFVNMSG